MPTPARDDVQTALGAYRAEIDQLDGDEREPALAHLTAAELQLDAADRWMAVHDGRKASEAARQEPTAEPERAAVAADDERA